MSNELLDDLQSSLERHRMTLNRDGDLVDLAGYHGRGARSALAEQLGQVLKPEKSAKKSLSEEMEMLHLKAATIPPMQHARTLPPLDSHGNVLPKCNGKLDLRAGGLVKK